MSLRPYQERGRQWVEDTIPTLARRSALVQLPTGGGKTEIARSLRLDFMIAPGVDLGRQLSRKLGGIPVYTPQELSLRLSRGQALPRAKRIGNDEARWMAAPKWGRIVDHYLEQETEIVSFDATPATPDGAGLGRWVDALYQAESVANLVDAGYLVPWQIEGPGKRQRELWKDPADAYLEHCPGQTALIFCEDKQHAAEVLGRLRSRGVAAAAIGDESSEHHRRWLLGYSDERQGNLYCDGWHPGALETGEIQVAVCAEILRQGIDLWRVSAILLARGVVSLPLYLQAVGRGGRPVPVPLRARHRKTHCTVVDLRGAASDLGHPEDERRWSLGAVAVERTRPELAPARSAPSSLFALGPPDDSRRVAIQCACGAAMPYRGDDRARASGWGTIRIQGQRFWQCPDHWQPAALPQNMEHPPVVTPRLAQCVTNGSRAQRAKLRRTLDRLREVDPRLGQALTAALVTVARQAAPEASQEWRLFGKKAGLPGGTVRINLLRHEPAPPKKKNKAPTRKRLPSTPESE